MTNLSSKQAIACLVLSSARSCSSSICQGRLSTAWLVSIVVFSCHNYGLQVVTRKVHRSSLRRLICPAHDNFIFITLLMISRTFVLSLSPDPDVGLSIPVCDVEHTSFHFGLCSRKFALCKKPLARNGNFVKNAVINIFFTVTSKMAQLHIFRGLWFRLA